MDERERPTAGLDPLAERGHLGQADAVVDDVVLAGPAAAEVDDRDPDRAYVDRKNDPGRTRLNHLNDGRAREVARGGIDQIGWPAELGDHRPEPLRRPPIVKRGKRRLPGRPDIAM